MVIMDYLQTQGFTKRGAALMVEAKVLEDPADRILLYATA
jgi:hypothetical protein